MHSVRRVPGFGLTVQFWRRIIRLYWRRSRMGKMLWGTRTGSGNSADRRVSESL